MKRLRVLVLFPLIAFSTCANYREAGRESNHRLTIVGTVVGYDQTMSMVHVTAAPQADLLFIRIRKLIKGRESATYVKVLYQHLNHRTELPREILDARNYWLFKLNRDRDCDSSLRELETTKGEPDAGRRVDVPRFKHTTGAEAEEIPDSATLPCYLLRPGDFKPVGSVR